MQNNIIKFYEFKDNINSGKTKKFFEILLLPILAFIFYLFFKVLFLNRVITDINVLSNVSKIVLCVSFIIVLCVYVIYSKTLKGIFLYSDHIQIVYAITKRNLLNIKPKIKYSSITKCENIANSVDNRIKYNIALNYISGSGDEYVMIETIDNQIFFFCVENQFEFICDIKARCSKNENGDSLYGKN